MNDSDEIIAEVRAVKDAIGREFNYDIRAIFEDIKRGEAELRGKGVPVLQPPPCSIGMEASALQRTRLARH